jgi:hypothetical protein
MKTKQAYCNHCNSKTLAHKENSSIGCFAHCFHLVLTICTGFLWGLIWIIHANYDNGVYRCCKCGGRVK